MIPTGPITNQEVRDLPKKILGASLPAVPDVKEEEKECSCRLGAYHVGCPIHWPLEKKEAVADSVEVLGQNELLPCPFCGTVPPNRTKDTVFHPMNGCPIGGIVFWNDEWSQRAAISVSDGGGSDKDSGEPGAELAATKALKCDLCEAPATQRSDTFLYCDEHAPRGGRLL